MDTRARRLGTGPELLVGSGGPPVHRARFLAIVSRDGAGQGTIYFDDGAGRAAAITPGAGVALPRSVVLDATLGGETLHALTCERAASVEVFRQAVEASHAAPAAPPGCLVQSLDIDKRPP